MEISHSFYDEIVKSADKAHANSKEEDLSAFLQESRFICIQRAAERDVWISLQDWTDCNETLKAHTDLILLYIQATEDQDPSPVLRKAVMDTHG